MPRHLYRVGAALAVLAILSPLQAAPTGAEGRKSAIRAAAGPLTLRLERTSARRTTRLQLGPTASPLPGVEERSTDVILEFSLFARERDALDRLDAQILAAAGDIRCVDDSGRASMHGSARLLDTEDGPRLRLELDGLSPKAKSIVSLSGNLPLFPQAARIRFHIPWLKDEVPLSVEFGGGLATLERFQLVGADSTLWVKVKPPSGFRVAPLEHSGSVSAHAMDIDGNLVNGGGISRIEQTGAGAEPEFRFFAPALIRTPSRLMLDVLCVAGEPQSVPFRLAGIPFPPSR